MNRTSVTALLAGALSLGACQQGRTSQTDEQIDAGTASGIPSPARQTPLPTSSPTPPPTAAGANPSKTDPLAGENDGYPDLSPVPLTGDAAKTEKGARAILLPWARGIELREFDQSWAMMGEAAKAQWSKARFNVQFHPLRDLTVAIPSGSMEGAAGSSYYTVPTTVTGTRADGAKAVLTGEVVMRRVNDVPGATREQLIWHIESVDLKPLSAAA